VCWLIAAWMGLGVAVSQAAPGSVVSIEGAPQGGNLLQNADFQSDWLCLMPENRSLVWCYLTDYFNRRDYNPDAWFCSGNWRWDNADGLPGERRLMLQGLNTTIAQSVNWVVAYDDNVLIRSDWIADDGGFPLLQKVGCYQPLKMVRDLTVRVRIRGQSVPSGAGTLGLYLDTIGVTTPLPTGTYDWQWVSLTLPASTWLASAITTNGTAKVLPVSVKVTFSYNNAAGSVELGRAELTEPGPAGPNLLNNGGFESVNASNYPVAWSAPAKFRHFHLKLFYLFQTWYHALNDNRGSVSVDTTVAHSGARSLKMIVPSGDEPQVISDPIVLNQISNRLIEVQAWIKTDHLAMMELQAFDQNGTDLAGYRVMQKSAFSPYNFTIIADNDWYLFRQVFRPTNAVQSLRLQLCARGVNGSTLEDTGEQPQNNVVGTIWWDDLRVYEPESTPAELAARGVIRGTNAYALPGLQLSGLDLGERLLGPNLLKATLYNPGAEQPFKLRWRYTSPAGNTRTCETLYQTIPTGSRVPFQVPYLISEPASNAFTEYRGTLEILNYAGILMASNSLWFSTWSIPIDIQLGALYSAPPQTNLYVRFNIGLTAGAMTNVSKVRLEIVRRANGAVTNMVEIPATPADLAAQRDKIPAEVYDDCRNLLLKDIDISMLPIQPFNNPERQWVLRVSAVDAANNVLARADSDPFCRLAHDPPQAAMTNVTITTNNVLLVDGKPWVPWGRIYGNAPVYTGPADPGAGKYRNLHSLPAFNLYGWRFGNQPSSHQTDDFTTIRYYCNAQTAQSTLNNEWNMRNLQCATAFAFGYPVYDTATMFARMGGQSSADAYLAWVSNAPMVAATGPGIEECFSEFIGRTPTELNGLHAVVDYLRSHTGKPVMASHGGYWNRFEFEKIDFFDIFDPETEPIFPANLHVDLQPITRGKAKAIWIRPQIYENEPYERLRFHTYVEFMRGARGWQFAQGIGDLSLFRGLHGEMEFMKFIGASTDPGPAIQIEPWMEHWSRRYNGKTYLIAATTRGLAVGRYRWTDDHPSPVGRSRVTTGRSENRNDDNSYCYGLEPLTTGPTVHGIHYMPDCQVWPAGSKLVQWLYLDPAAPPTNMVFMVKADGRWKNGACWGSINPDYTSTPQREEWFIRAMYKNAVGFAVAGGWGAFLYDSSKAFTLASATDMGAMPSAGFWHKIEVPLSDIGITTQMVDGVAFIHNEEGRVWWSHTTIVDPDGHTSVLFGDSVELPPSQLAGTRISVAGMTEGMPIKVLFEDRTISGSEGYFTDDFRGKDLYQRFGGDFGLGYGAAPVALHIYEIDGL